MTYDFAHSYKIYALNIKPKPPFKKTTWRSLGDDLLSLMMAGFIERRMLIMSRKLKDDFVSRSSKLPNDFGIEVGQYTHVEFMISLINSNIYDITRDYISENVKNLEYFSFSATKLS